MKHAVVFVVILCVLAGTLVINVNADCGYNHIEILKYPEYYLCQVSVKESVIGCYLLCAGYLDGRLVDLDTKENCGTTEAFVIEGEVDEIKFMFWDGVSFQPIASPGILPVALPQPTATPAPTPTPEPTATPEPPPVPTATPLYEEQNAEILENLNLMVNELDYVLNDPEMEGAFPEGPQRELLRVVHQCIAETIPYGSSVIIDERFIRKTFREEVIQVQTYYDTIQKLGEEAIFRESMAIYLPAYVIEWLMNNCGINI